MKKYLFVLLLSMFSLNAFACVISDTRGLPDEMVQKLKVECEQMKLTAVSTPKLPDLPAVTREDVSEWAKISQEFAKAIGIAAREVGVTVNEFMVTPAGILTAGVLLWVVFGKTFIGIFACLLLFVAVVMFNRSVWYSNTTWETRKSKIPYRGDIQVKVRHYLTWKAMEDGAIFMSLVSYGILALALLVVFVVS